MPDAKATGEAGHNHDHVTYHIIVNGEQKEVPHRELSFHQVVELAFPGGPFGDKITYTVSFTYPDGRDGSIVKGQSVKIVDGMIFNVGNTDQS
jgi:hypothetical protein